MSQVNSKLYCPWCKYRFEEKETDKDLPAYFFYAVCPKCNDTFQYRIDSNNQFHTKADCQLNGHRHNWKYSDVPGYASFKKCRRCGIEEKKPTQTILKGFENTLK
jgi:hypothetical protein